MGDVFEAEFSGGVYSDPWQTFRSIGDKLKKKKKTFRKPNFEEASADYAALSKRLETEEDTAYAALAIQKAARCEGEQGNRDQEALYYRRAARLFIKAEKERYSLGLPTRWQYLHEAISSYTQLIKMNLAKDRKEQAAAIHYELAYELLCLDHEIDALSHFTSASEHFADHPHGLVSSLRWMCCIQTSLGEFHKVRSSLRQLRKTLLPLASQLSGVWETYLSDVEVATVFILLAHRPNDEQLDDFEAAIRQRYFAPASMDEALPPDSQSHLRDADAYINLRSFVLAVTDKEPQYAGQALTQLRPHLPTYLTDLGLSIIRALHC